VDTETKLGFIYPGQGSQEVGMGRGISGAKNFRDAKEATGTDIEKLCLYGPLEELTRTINAQPSILTISAIYHEGLASELKKLGIEISLLAGHSLGEISAIYASGGITNFKDAVKLAYFRGKYMEGISGKMAAVMGLDFKIIEKICQITNCDIANINTPGQIVISGTNENIIDAIKFCKDEGAKKCTELNVSAPFHSKEMGSASKKLKHIIETDEFKDTFSGSVTTPIISSVTTEIISNMDEIKKYLPKQILSSVKWAATITKMVELGINIFVEVGPGDVLTKFLKRIIPADYKYCAYNINSLKSLNEFITKIKQVKFR
jgi:[acyl-carrier-protein] S-malonyltransferase